MSLQCRAGIAKVLLMDLLLRRGISGHVSIVKGLLHVSVLGTQNLVQHYIPNLLANVTRVLVKEHSGKIVSEIAQLRIGRNVHNLAKACGGGFVEEAVGCEEEAGVGGAAVRRAERGSRGYIPCGEDAAASILVVVDGDLCFGAVVELTK